MEKRERAIDRVRKLLEFNKENNASEGEIETASTLIRKIMNEYDLSLEHVQQKEIEDGCIEEGYSTEYKNVPTWVKYLSSRIARALECRSIYTYTWSDLRQKNCYKVSFVGYKTDAEVAAYFFEYLYNELWRLSGEFVRDKNYDFKSQVQTARQNFIIGASEAIYNRLKKTEPNTSSGKGLMVVKFNAVNAAYVRMHPNTSSMGCGYVYSDADAKNAGYKTGQSMPLNKGIRTSNAGNGILSLR